MPNSIQVVGSELGNRFKGKQDSLVTFAAIMGRGDGSNPSVEGRSGYVWVRVGHDEVVQMAYNTRIMPRDDLAIYVGYAPEQPNLLQVLSIRQEAYVDTGQGFVPPVINHAQTHYYGGGDDVYVEWRRIMSFRVGREQGFWVYIDPGVLHRPAGFQYFPEQAVYLGDHIPGAGALYVLIYLDASGVARHRVGTAVASTAILRMEDIPDDWPGEFALAAVRLYFGQTAIGDTPLNPDIVDLRFPQSQSAGFSTPTPHDLLSASHGDTLLGAVLDGDVIIGNVTPEWSRLVISIPGANVRNVLGVDNAELRPSWKTALDAVAPTTITAGDAAAAGTSLVFSHRDHLHGAPATYPATAHNLLSASHGDTTASAVARGDLVVGVAGPAWDNLALGGAAGSFLTRDANDVAWSGFYLDGTPGNTYDLDAAGGVPGGNDTNVQFNGAGAFEGTDNLTWDDTRLMAQIADAATTTVAYPLRVSHITSGTTDVGFGAGLEFQLEDAADTKIITGSISSSWVNAGALANSQLSLNLWGAVDMFLTQGVVEAIRIVAPQTAYAVVGNARGEGSVDIQVSRSAATQVASGSISTIAGGSDNTASGIGSTSVGGVDNNCSGNYGTSVGGGNNVVSGTRSLAAGASNANVAGDYSVAMGRRPIIAAAHDGSFLFADWTDADFNSLAAGEAAFRARGGFRVAYDDSNYWQCLVGAAIGVVPWTIPANAAGYFKNDGAGGLTWDAGTTVAHNLLGPMHDDTIATSPPVRGSLIVANISMGWAEFTLAGATGSFLTRDAGDPLWSGFYLTGTAGGTTNFAVTNAKTLTLTAVDDYNVTFPATGIVALLGTANVFTANNTFDTNTLFVDSANHKTGVGVVAFTANGGILEVSNGITFPAAQSACSNVNTLDDYEEGTVVVTMTAGTSGTITLDVNTLAYTKIGRVVHITGYLHVSAVNAPVGALTINGLPFACVNDNSCWAAVSIYVNNLVATAATAIQGRVVINTTTIYLVKFAAGTVANIAADVQIGSLFMIQATYFAAT